MLKSTELCMNSTSNHAVPATGEYWLDDLHIDVQTRRVLRDGADLGVTSLSYDLLLALVRAAPGLVSFDELMQQVWPGVIVSPETLTQRVKLLRQALGDSAEKPRYILAVRGHGYRLLAPVTTRASGNKASAGSPPAPRRLWRLAAPAVVLLTSIAAAAWWMLRPTAGEMSAATRDEAYRYFLQAESVVNGTPESFLAAISLYDEALARDPALVRAWSGRAMNRAALVWNGSRLARGLETAEADARHALQLDPRDIRAHSAMASIRALRGDWLAARSSFQTALELNPLDAEVIGRQAISLLLPAGQLLAARSQALAAQRLAPDSGFAASLRVFIDHASGIDTDIVEQAQLAIARGADSRQLQPMLASAAVRRGQAGEAADHAIRALPPEVLDAGGTEAVRLAYAALDDPSRRPAALDALRGLVATPAWARADPRAGQSVYYLLAALGGIDELYHEMHRLLRREAGADLQITAIGMLWSPEMRPFRLDKRFELLVNELGLLAYWQQTGPPDLCTLSGTKVSCR